MQLDERSHAHSRIQFTYGRSRYVFFVSEKLAYEDVFAGYEVSLYPFCSASSHHGGSYPRPEGDGATLAAPLGAANLGISSVFTPKVGAEFESAEEAFGLYNMFSWESGFGIRYGCRSANKDGYPTRMDIVCSCFVSAYYLQLHHLCPSKFCYECYCLLFSPGEGFKAR